VIILPNLIWQYINHFPSLDLYNNSFSTKNISRSYLQVIIEQITLVNPLTFPLLITGIIALMFPNGKPYRLFLIAYAFLLMVIITAQSSRPDRIASIYTFFVAYGAVAVEQYLKSFWLRFAQISVATMMIIGGIILFPFFCPILPPPTLKTYVSGLGLNFDIEEGKKGEPIPQWLADRIGWRELSAEVAQVYQSLPDNERLDAVIVSTNYGEAGALEIYGAEFGLPKVYCTHNSFHSWGPPPNTVKTYIGVYIDVDDVKQKFKSVEQVSVYHCMDCTKPQRNIPIYILREPNFSIEKEWINFKNYH
jgi:hypothetical protein